MKKATRDFSFTKPPTAAGTAFYTAAAKAVIAAFVAVKDIFSIDTNSTGANGAKPLLLPAAEPCFRKVRQQDLIIQKVMLCFAQLFSLDAHNCGQPVFHPFKNPYGRS